MYGQDLTTKTCSIITIYRAAIAVISSLYIYTNKVQGSILLCFGLFCLVYASLNKGISDCRLFFLQIRLREVLHEGSINFFLEFYCVKSFPLCLLSLDLGCLC